MHSRLGRTSLLTVALASALGVLTVGVRETLAGTSAETSCVNTCQFGEQACFDCCRASGDDFGVCVQPSGACVCGVG
jgi:hypothetical protein